MPPAIASLKFCCSHGLLVLLTVGALLPQRAMAQVVPDDTLGAESSQVIINGVTVDGAAADLIRQGARRGENVFHSFASFSIAEGQRVYFDNPAGVARIFSRVTGGDPSNILGTLGTLGTADLFFLNPNGILFGPNAQLDVGGSFIASTADAFEFAEAGSFSARVPETPSPLLTVQPTAFLFGQSPGPVSPGAIVVQPPAAPLMRDDVVLEVPNGESLVLLGGDIVINGRQLNALGGRIELGSIARAGTVGLEPDGWLTFPTDVVRGSVTLNGVSSEGRLGRDNAFLDVRSADRGDIGVTARTIDLTRSVLGAGILTQLGTPQSQAGDIVLNATESVRLIDSVILNDLEGNSRGIAGDIRITTPILEVLNGGRLQSVAFGSGNAGNVFLDVSDRVRFAGGNDRGSTSDVIIAVNNDAFGDAGNLEINTQVLELFDGALLISGTQGQGNAGDIVVNASERIVLRGEDRAGLGSGIFTSVNPGGTGDGGNIAISTAVLEARDGAQISSSTFGLGNAGRITINANERVQFVGTDSAGFRAGAFTLVGRGAIGSGNTIQITAPVLEVLNGAVLSSETRGQGDAGNIVINASQFVRFAGLSENRVRRADGSSDFIGSAAFSNTTPGSIGDGGTINITTSLLEVLDGAELASSTNGKGDAGNIVLNVSDHIMLRDSSILATSNSTTGRGGDINATANRLTLTNQSEISTRTLSTDGGNITLTLGELLALFDNSLISTEAGTAEAGGNGGDITITTLFLVADPDENSDIVADAFDGNGGNVNITATGGIFGIAPRPFRTPQSDITASSRNGVSGVITVQTPDVDPSQATLDLPTTFAAPEIARGCREFVQTGSSFVVTGRGGIPQGPLDLPTTVLWQDVLPIEGELPSDAETRVNPAADVSSTSQDPIVEAQGLMKGANGEITLLAPEPQPPTIALVAECQP